ncbi:VOC family protein [Nodosilinea sp. LEGE 07088]|uniref:VOC family protein n=1 Tax=Nodosilinea sp. LEGE 07088 TaxID=2777968 RepID=UPI001882D8F7|nr:VOC family protein [Nodosilinea sp. LEGE 07088]MBE9140209.1 VOC family protein [Nodosilinea sp. LEGE 07088]
MINSLQLSQPFLGDIVEICIVTRDHQRTMAGLVKLGIGPWRIYTFDETTVAEQTYRGKSAKYAIKVCFAKAKNVIWEIMQPLSGSTIFQEFLDRHDEGIHHIAFNCDDRPWEARIQEFKSRGFHLIQSGIWMGQNAFAFFDTESETTTVFETYCFPTDFIYPEPEAWFPANPLS